MSSMSSKVIAAPHLGQGTVPSAGAFPVSTGSKTQSSWPHLPHTYGVWTESTRAGPTKLLTMLICDTTTVLQSRARPGRSAAGHA